MFPLPCARQAAMPTQPPIHWVPRILFPVVRGQSLKLTTHLNLARRLQIRETIPQLILTSLKGGSDLRIRHTRSTTKMKAMLYNFPAHLTLAGPSSEQSMAMIKWYDVRDIKIN
jgi:hypothetical protein